MPRTSMLTTSSSRTLSLSRLPYVMIYPKIYIMKLTSAFQKTRRRTYRAHGRINPYQGHPCHVEIILAASEEEVERAKDKDVVQSLTGLNRRQVARKRIEAARAWVPVVHGGSLGGSMSLYAQLMPYFLCIHVSCLISSEGPNRDGLWAHYRPDSAQKSAFSFVQVYLHSMPRCGTGRSSWRDLYLSTIWHPDSTLFAASSATALCTFLDGGNVDTVVLERKGYPARLAYRYFNPLTERSAWYGVPEA